MKLVPAFWILGYLVFPTAWLYPFLIGQFGGALFYDGVHLAFHFDDQFPTWVMHTQWFKHMKAAHMRHHFRDNSKDFGVTLDLWDRVLGTKDGMKGE